MVETFQKLKEDGLAEDVVEESVAAGQIRDPRFSEEERDILRRIRGSF